MSKKQAEKDLSKRQKMREQRAQKERQQRLLTIGIIAAVAIILLAIIVVPTVQKAVAPAGDFKRITPVAYPQTDGKTIGDPQAKVKIELYEDFKCSACKSYWQGVEPEVIKQLVETGKAYYVFHQFPFLDDRLDVKDSDQAAMASECAAEQNRFWDYKDMLFTNLNFVAGEFSDVRLSTFAKTLGLDVKQFDACIAEKRYQAQIDADIALGNNMKVGGTPSVFINGKEVSPGKVPTFEQIYQMVEEALASGS